MQEAVSFKSARRTASDRRYVFVIGCGRSGTTWLQMLLAQHPDVATSAETKLFSAYFGQFEQAWRHDQSMTDGTGLSHVLSEEAFFGYCADLARKILDNVRENNPGASTIVEKTPLHARYGSLILKMFPDAFFVHIVRDPRGVVGSLRAAHRTFGRTWAPASVAEGALMWRESVEPARAIGDLTDRYQEIRYEDLLSPRASVVLDELLEGIGLDSDTARTAAIIEACRIENLRKADSRIKENRTRPETRKVFFRKGQADGWQQELSPADVRIVECIAGDLMRQCGYQASTPGAKLRKPARLLLYQALDGLEWRVNKHLRNAFSHARSIT